MRNTLNFVVLSIVFARLGIIWQVVRCMCSGTLQPFLCLHWHTPNRPFASLPIWLDSNSYFPFTASKIYSFHAMFCFQGCVVLFILCVFFCVLCTQCCQCLWIVHSWLPLRITLTFIYYESCVVITNESRCVNEEGTDVFTK